MIFRIRLSIREFEGGCRRNERKMSPAMKKAWVRFGVLSLFALIFVFFALFASVLAPFDPLESHYADMLKPPSTTYLFGTDQLGRDLFSRILYGGKSSLRLHLPLRLLFQRWES